MPIVKMPNGDQVRFPDDMPKEQIKGMIASKFPEFAAQQSPQTKGPAFTGGTFNALTEAMQNGATLGWGDEFFSGTTAPFRAAYDYATGGDFDIGDAYSRTQQRLQDRQNSREEQHPVASTIGEITGGLVTAGGLAKSGVTLMGQGLGAKGAIAEGALYGGAVGSGNAEQGEGLQDGITGAAIGGVTAGAADKITRGVANRFARTKQATPSAPSIDDLGNEAAQLYQQAEHAGVRIKPKATKRLAQNVMLRAGRINEKLRPKTAGMVEEFAAKMDQPLSLQELDELRQQIGQAMQRAEPQDLRTLALIKDQVDEFSNNIAVKDITGDIRGFALIKDARAVYQRRAKAETIQEMFEKAEINTGQYTQSGIANTIGKEFRILARNKKKLRMFTAEERATIKQIAMGRTSPATVRWLAKFAPRGSFTSVLGAVGGTTVGGPVVGVGLPFAGHMAAKSVDDATVNAARSLQGNMARGAQPQQRQLAKPLGPILSLPRQAGGLAGGLVAN